MATIIGSVIIILAATLTFKHHAHRADQTYKLTSTYQHYYASYHYVNNTWTDKGQRN